MNRYSLIYADPAWSYGNTISNGAAVDHYPTMSLLDMKRLPVWELAADNAVLAMWYTGTHNQEASSWPRAWGFTVRTMKGFTWVKLNQLAELRITKAPAEGEVADFYDFLDLLECRDAHERRQSYPREHRRRADRHPRRWSGTQARWH